MTSWDDHMDIDKELARLRKTKGLLLNYLYQESNGTFRASFRNVNGQTFNYGTGATASGAIKTAMVHVYPTDGWKKAITKALAPDNRRVAPSLKKSRVRLSTRVRL